MTDSRGPPIATRTPSRIADHRRAFLPPDLLIGYPTFVSFEIMLGIGRPRPWTLLGAIASIVLLSLGGRVVASEVPEGLPAGPWVLSPALEANYGWDSNLFYTSSVAGPVSDTVLTAAPSLIASLPFRNSLSRLGYKAVWTRYGSTTLDRELVQDLGADLTLNFSTLDRLGIRAHETQGVAFNQVDQGGATVFRGDPYDYSTQSIEGAREEYGHRGYKVRLTREVLNFPPETTVGYFEFSGYNGYFEYREPLSRILWLVGSYEGRRYDNFLANDKAYSGNPYRTERSDLLWIGLHGLVAPKDIFSLRLGWGDFRFPGGPGAGFRGVVVDGLLQVHAGPSTRLEFTATRRPWPAFFFSDNYYITERLGLKVEHTWPRQSRVGLETSAERFLFESLPVPEAALPAGFARKDNGLRALLYANLMVSRQFGFRVSVERSNRDSNYVFAAYRRTAYFGGIILGWPTDVP